MIDDNGNITNTFTAAFKKEVTKSRFSFLVGDSEVDQTEVSFLMWLSPVASL